MSESAAQTLPEHMPADALQTTPVKGRLTQVVRHLAPNADTLILVVPGNPGGARFYVPLAQELFRRSRGQCHVAVASHVGQVPALPPPSAQGHFTLADQIQHKLDFIDALPPVQTIHLVGHSIGCWIALGILDRLPEAQRGRAILVCPTIERMAISPNGQRLTPLFNRYRRLGVALAALIHRLPGRHRLLQRAMLRQTPSEHRETMLQAMLDLSPAAIDNVLGMAGEEMRVVTALPVDKLRLHGRRLSLCYAPGDPWNLPGMAAEVEALGLDVEVLRGPPTLKHSFVLHDCSLVVDMIMARVAV